MRRRAQPPSATTVNAPSAPVSVTVADELSCVTELLDSADNLESRYPFTTTSPSALGVSVEMPVIVLLEALITMSPTDNPFFTLKFLVVMVPISPS